MNSRASARAFTLLEILVVLAIIIGLIVLAIPVFQRLMEGGRATSCVSNLRNLGAALNLYLAEHNMVMPTLKAGRATRDEGAQTIDNTLDKYVKDTSVFACPSDHKWAQASGTSYSWNNALNGQSATNLNFLGVLKDHGRIPVLGDKEGFHPYTDSKVNILYADGHATKDVNFVTGN